MKGELAAFSCVDAAATSSLSVVAVEAASFSPPFSV